MDPKKHRTQWVVKARNAPKMDPKKHKTQWVVKARNARKTPTHGNTEGGEVNGGEQLSLGILDDIASTERAPKLPCTEVDGGEQLLPGILDDIALAEIAPKLPWKSFCSLEYVSPAWLRVVRSREAHDARVRYRRPELLVLFRHPLDEVCNVLSLYSTRDGFYFELPPLPLPVCERGIPNDCTCVTLDSKVYILGGRQLNFFLVYVFDLAGRPRQWTQCASTLGQLYEYFKCAALHGKIYVGRTSRVTEVYDPNANTWSLIKPMPLRQQVDLNTRAVIEAIADRFENRYLFRASSLFQLRMLAEVGEELFVISCEGYFSLISMNSQRLALKFRFTADVYHPVKDEWRVETFYPRDGADSIEADDWTAILFSAKGKLYRMKDWSISVLDVNTRKWMLQHHCLFPDGLPDIDYFDCPIIVVTAMGDELLATISREWNNFILQSEGFGSKNLHLTWHILDKRIYYDPSQPLNLYPIEV